MQKIFTNYRASVDSFPLGEMNVGIMKPGRYNGFSTKTNLSGLNMTIGHDNPINVKKTDINGDYINFGAILTPNGSIIHETEPIPIAVDDNAGNSNIRMDLLVCEHEYVQVVGGQPAIYLVIKGSMSATELPVVPNPEKQVAIGYFTIPAEALAATAVTYEPLSPPIPGDYTLEQLWEDMGIEFPTATTETPGMVEFATEAEAIARTADNKALSPATANVMTSTESLNGMIKIASQSDMINGTDTSKAVTPQGMHNYGRIRTPLYHTTGDVTVSATWNGRTVIFNGDSGTTPLVTLTLPDTLPANFSMEAIARTQNVRVVGSGTSTVLVPSGKQPQNKTLNSTITIRNTSSTDRNFILDGILLEVAPSGSTGLVPMNAAVPYFPESNLLGEFDGTGLGIASNVLGWAICNGNNGTRDLRGRFLLHIHSGDSRYDEVGKTGGLKEVTLTVNQMPKHSHSLGNTAPNDSGDGYITAGNTTTTLQMSTQEAGGDQPHENLPPFYSTIYIQRVS